MKVLLLSWLVTMAAPAPAPQADRPWARGVSAEHQTQALERFRQANGKLRDALYAEAQALYLEALGLWDHPAVHYNLALALLNLDRPVEAYEHLVESLRYGVAPLDTEKVQQAERYKALIEKQLTRLVVRCSLQGAIVRLDGRQLFVAPGRWEGMVRAGPHALVGTREGHVPVERAEVFVGGEVKEVELTLFRAEELTEYRRRWSPAIEWSMLGGSVAAAATGLLLRLVAQDTYAHYDAEVKLCATSPSAGCTPDATLMALEARGDALRAGSVAAFITGGVALVTSAVLAYLNRPLPFLRAVALSASAQPSRAGAAVFLELAWTR